MSDMTETTGPVSPSEARGGFAAARGETAVHCRVFRDGYPSPAPNDLADLSEILAEARTFVWFDVVDPGPRDLDVLEEEFKLHPLAVEDAVQAHQRPKIESYDTYWFVDVQAVTIAGERLRFHEIALFVGAKFVVSVRHDPAYPLEEIERRWLAHPDRLRQESGFLLYTILDTIVDGYFPIVDMFQERVDELEVSLFRRQPLHDEVLRQIFVMKQDAQAFRHAAVPMRDVLTPIMRGDVALFSPDELAYYRDVYDHATRVVDGIDAARDLVNSALDIHLSVVASRQSEVSKQLTVIATIFLPLSFLTGFFGQNFGFLIGHIAGARAFWGVGIGGEIVTLAVLLVLFKYKGWF